MMAHEVAKHQVVIVGGGITGLTLALMLQHLKIDYVLLEAYGSVTPNMGASIGLFPNGLRILDQLGLFDKVYAKAQPVRETIYRDGKSGKRIMTRCAAPLLKERHGYSNMFMERYELLRVLYDGIQDKSRILVNKKVTRVETGENSALVYAEDGSVFEGQLAVGADGVHSNMRKEMWRNADEKEPEAIPAHDRQNIPCEHACIFGTANPTAGVNPGQVVGMAGHGTSAGVMGGPRREVFFFWFWTLPQSMRSVPMDKIPRFTEDDKQRELSRAASTILSDNGLRMCDLSKNFQFSGVTALPNFVLHRWHYGRIVVIGDAAHKFNPLVGQGGNSCMESCAALVNSLQEYLGTEPAAKTSWSVDTLHEAFVFLEKKRVDRVTDMVDQCQAAMRSLAWETWRSELSLRYLAPLIPLAKFTDFHSNMIRGGVSLKNFNPAAVVHQWPYYDEEGAKAPALPLVSTGAVTAASLLAFAALMWAKLDLSQRGILANRLLG